MKKAGDILSAFFDERLVKEGKTYSELFKSWFHIAGERLAAHSRIVELERNILFVEADHPGWIMILQSKEKEILDQVRRSFPNLTINGISIRLAKSGMSVPETKLEPTEALQHDKKDPRIEISDNVDADPDYDKIHDPHLKELLQRLERGIKAKHT